MIAYAQYGPDARIKAYVKTLERVGRFVDLFVLQEEGKKRCEQNGRTRIFYLTAKYQGANSILYIFSYILFFLKAFLMVSLHAVREQYDVVHVHNMPNFIIFDAIVAKILGARILLDVHDLMPVNYMVKFRVSESHPLIKILILEQKISASMASQIICADHMQKAYLERSCGIDGNKIVVFMNLPEEETFQRKNHSGKHSRSDGQFRLMYHGTIAKRLGIDIILMAIAKVGKEIPIHLSIYGAGDFLHEAVRLADDLGLDGRVYFSKAFFPAEKVPEMVGGMDVGVVGNRRSLATECFMMPVKLLEYVYLKIPVVAPRLKIIKSYFDEDMLKFYEPENVGDLARCIVELYRSQNERTLLADRASRFYEEHSWRKQADQYLEIVAKSS